MTAEHFRQVLRLQGLPPAPKWTLAALAYRANAGGYVSQPLGEIALDTGLSRRGVQKCLDRLEDLGLIFPKRIQGRQPEIQLHLERLT